MTGKHGQAQNGLIDGADPVTVQGELAGDYALVVPREAAVLLAKILGFHR